MGTFIIKQITNGKYMFNLKAINGEVILTSEGYTAKSSCLRGIESVRVNAVIDARYERKRSKDGQYYFILKAANGEIIGISEMYNSADSLETGVSSVKGNAPGAGLDDL